MYIVYTLYWTIYIQGVYILYITRNEKREARSEKQEVRSEK